ncbi:MAG: dihydroxy-acid dehydratase [Thaumarchaeota archaeon]|jgi:dihydroxy-acid dehydratase|nr:dihydroxy-acid dehydratase [Nitrososphaerota archaeon]
MRSDAVKKGVDRAPHRSLLHAIGLRNQDFEKPFIGVVNSFTNVVPGHVHLNVLAENVSKGVRDSGGVPFIFNTIAVCDGIAMNHDGMRFSLPSREVIADSVEIMVSAHVFDALVFISSCDKIVPGHLLAAARLNLPSIFVTGGPMYPGLFKGRRVDLVSVFEALGEYREGRITLEELREFEQAACPGAGSCAGLFTANTMACLVEAMGISLPGMAATHAEDEGKKTLAYESGRRIVELWKEGLRFKDIVKPESIVNAIIVDNALGGSTNTVLHLSALAKEAGYELPLKTFDELSRRIPTLALIRPSGESFMIDFYNAGGVPSLMKTLKKYLNLDVLTVTGRRLRELVEEFPDPRGMLIRSPDNPYRGEGGIAVLWGSLAPEGAVIKLAGTPVQLRTFRGRARVFNSEEEAVEALEKEDFTVDTVVVVRYEGLLGGPGMREMLMPTSLIVGRNLVERVALVTDGRFSGGTKGIAIGHVSPEAYLGGPIALVEDGDEILVDVPERRLDLLVDRDELEERRRKWVPPAKRLESRFLAKLRENRFFT